jgi:hypothetical protein
VTRAFVSVRRWLVKRREVTEEAIKRAAAKSTTASARLEQRVVPPGYRRPSEVDRYVAQLRPRS